MWGQLPLWLFMESLSLAKLIKTSRTMILQLRQSNMIPTNVSSSTTMQYLSYKQGNKTTHQETSPKSSCEEYKILTEQSRTNMFY